jgi:hypothetical protein
MKRREEVPFNLSFLDVMCCGLGAVILLVLLLSGRVQQRREDHTKALEVELARVTVSYHAARADTRPTPPPTRPPPRPAPPATQPTEAARPRPEPPISQPGEPSAAELEAQANQLEERTREARKAADAAADLARQTTRAISTLEKETSALERAIALLGSRPTIPERGARPIGFTGDGQRQYLTGIKLGGERTLVLVDASASMLDETIVNIVRRKVASPAARREAPKWTRVVRSTHWVVANLPANKRFQVYIFNTEAHPAIAGTDQQWLSTSDPNQLGSAIAAIRNLAPERGTSLHHAFAAAHRLNPRPDSIILLTDGLPTQGFQPPRSHTISAGDRLKLFEAATAQVPPGIPVNTLLFPIEGDPAAAEAFWRLAIATRGSLITPARDWP